MTNTTITKQEALETIFYTVFTISLVTKKQFVNYWMKNWTKVKDNMDLIDYSKLVIECVERENEIRDELYKYYNK